jgi:hypothetical protein
LASSSLAFSFDRRRRQLSTGFATEQAASGV